MKTWIVPAGTTTGAQALVLTERPRMIYRLSTLLS
jgi:hypothetical protein